MFDREWDPVHGYLVPPEQIFAAGAATYLRASSARSSRLPRSLPCIAPMFGSARDYLAALKVATYGAIPVMLAGATLVIPVMAIVGIVGLCHTLFLYWLGVRRVLQRAGRRQQTEFVGISIVLLTFASVARRRRRQRNRTALTPPRRRGLGRRRAPNSVHYAPAMPPAALQVPATLALSERSSIDDLLAAARPAPHRDPAVRAASVRGPRQS